MGSGGVAIAALPTVICLKVPFSDGLGGGAFLTLIKNPASATPPHPPPKKARARKAGMSKKEKGSSDIWSDLKSASHLIALASDDFHTE